MYDTIRLQLITDECERVIGYLTDVRIMIKPTGEYSHSGSLENMKVSVGAATVGMNGSFPKFLHGNNLVSFTRADTERTIEKLSDLLHLPVKESKVSRIDIAANFIMKQPVRDYITLLGEASHFEKRPYCKTGLYYNSGRRSMLFYDKTKEYRDKKKAALIPEMFKGRNVLRYELRFNTRLKRQFDSEVKAVDLYKEYFYIDKIKRWQDSYFSIKKVKTFKGRSCKMKNVGDYREHILALHFKDKSRFEKALNDLERARETGVMSDREYYRCKKETERILNNAKYFEPNDSILELDDKVKQAAKYCR